MKTPDLRLKPCQINTRDSAMPRYYFNVYNDEITIDEEGSECADSVAARQHAIMSAREIACENIRATGGFCRADHIVIMDKDKNEIARVQFGDAITVRDEG